MDAFVDQRDYALLDQDRYTFFVLRRIIGGSCRLLLSDHENLIVCYTGAYSKGKSVGYYDFF